CACGTCVAFLTMARSGRRRSFFREAGNLSLRRATTRCTCICSCTVLESYPSVRGSPILALTCVNAEPTLLSRSDTPPDLAFFAPYASLRGVESCSSSSPPAGRPASRYLVLVACRAAGGAARERGSPARFGGNSRHLPWVCFLRSRAIAA